MTLVKVFGTALISQITTFLNAVIQPFEGTIFVFEDWQQMANKSAIASGFVLVLVFVAVIENRSVTTKSIIACGIASGILLGACAGIHFLLASGFAPTTTFLFWMRNIIWIVVYIVVLNMVSVTVALVLLRIFNRAVPAK
jgi:hypothetical protein